MVKLENFNIHKLSFNTMHWSLLLGSSGLGAIVSKLISLFIEIKKGRTAASKSIVDINTIYTECMKPVLDNTDAERYLVVKVENGGGRITPGAQLFSTVIYEDYRRPLRTIMENYQRFKINKETTELLTSVVGQGSARVTCQDLEKGSSLKTALEANDITYVELFFIAQTNERLFYASIGTSSKVPNPFDNSVTRQAIEVSINNLRNIFTKYIKYIK